MSWNQERGEYAYRMRKRGTPLLVTPEEFAGVVRLLEKARSAGMSDRMIVEQTGVSVCLPGKIRRGIRRTIHRDTMEKLLKLRPERPDPASASSGYKVAVGAPVSPVGTVRRIQALRADGFPGRLVGGWLGVSYEAVSQMARAGRDVVLASTRLSVAELYADLDGRWPEEFGVSKHDSGRCSTYARRAGYAPRSCWDPDTIDDPQARPEWTGRCGSVFGWYIHRAEGIPACQPCADAREAGDIVFSGERFRAFREGKGFSRPRLAERIGVNPSTIQYWETGRSIPTRQNKLDLALRVLDVTLEEVCEQEV